jgi:hypothetical protein
MTARGGNLEHTALRRSVGLALAKLMIASPLASLSTTMSRQNPAHG